MIKKIPIKGISRDPSGQVSSDGFCAESLNVQLDMGEVAPAMKPRKVKDAGGNPVSVGGEILYIHKGIGYENLLYKDGRNILYTATIGTPASGSVYDGLETGEYVKDVVSVGNTVIVATNKDMYYILWRDGAYHFLGNKIPIPEIHFRIGDLAARRSEIPELFVPNHTDFPHFVDSGGNFTMWEYENYADVMPWGSLVMPSYSHEHPKNNPLHPSKWGNSAADNKVNHEYQQAVLDTIWAEIDELVNEKAANGKAYFPVFVRYAVRLYDGTSYAQSIPVLMGADLLKYLKVRTGVVGGRISSGTTIEIHGGDTYDGDDFYVFVPLYKKEGFAGIGNTDVAQEFFDFMQMRMGLPEPYSICADYSSCRGIFDGWEDIVSGVDIYVSTQLGPQMRDAAKMKVVDGFYAETTEDDKDDFIGLYDIVIDPKYTEEKQEELLLLHQATYLAKSYTIQEFNSLSGEKVLDDINFNSDYLMAREALNETPQSMHHTVGSRLFNYNKRLLVADAEQYLSHGYPFLHSVKWSTQVQDGNFRYRFVYHIKGENGENIVICRDENGNAQITPKNGMIVNGSSNVFYESPCAWLAYPDSRCYQIDVYQLEGQSVKTSSYKTKVFDQADVAYVFLGFGKPVNAVTSVQAAPSDEELTYKMPNTLVVSKPNNPFVFPATDAVTFTAGEIINLAVATKPLSEGQFGQFPLYVFTDEGVFALSVDGEGRFQTNHPVTRDILLSKDSIVGIEQGVFFAAARGLLLLQGSKVTKVSSEMDGLPDALGGDLLRQVETRFLGAQMDDPWPFRTFLHGCLLAYDYANARILVLNRACSSMYAYKFDTQSWHRLQTGDGTPLRVLNSFPEAQVVMESKGNQSVLDFSVIAENEDAVPLKGLVYTRDLDLDGADIYKTISRLKVRGRYADGHVKWQLQGSNDGVRYQTVHSLWGPSWKWYRIALVTMLGKDERISYVELEYVPRFTDKIR